MPQVGNTIRGIHVFASQGIEALTCKCPTRGRVAPKLACVQDIRPHVPELGCTSAVQNEKYIFSFCTASLFGVYVNLKLTN